MKKLVVIVCVAGLACILVACAAGTPEADHAAAGGVLSQLVLGFWHGLIAPVTLIIEIIRKLVPHAVPWPWRMYGGHDSVAYDIGFYFGLAGGPTFLGSRWRQ